MIYKFRNVEIYYKFQSRKNEVTNVFLHGWGADSNSLAFCEKSFGKHGFLSVDFPPFGKSEMKIKDWTIFTYANMVISLCQHLGIKKYNIIGHSFGGRVAIVVAVLCKDEVQKVVLVDSAGLKPRRFFGYYFKVLSYKVRKRFGMDISNFGSCDYLALSNDMKRIFNSIVNTHLDEFLPFIKAETLIIFGENDKVTPLYMAKKLKRKIKNSKLSILKNAGHFSFVDRKVEFMIQLKEFLEPS